MATYEQRDMSGSLFKNDKRESETHANARGSAMIEGVAYWMDAWTNGEGDKRYQSLKFKRKDKQEKPASPAHGRDEREPKKYSDGFSDVDSDIPF